MKKENKYMQFLESMKDDTNKQLIDIVKKGFASIHEEASELSDRKVSLNAMDIPSLAKKVFVKIFNEDNNEYLKKTLRSKESFKSMIENIIADTTDEIISSSLEYDTYRTLSGNEEDNFYIDNIEKHVSVIGDTIREVFTDRYNNDIDSIFDEVIYTSLVDFVNNNMALVPMNEGIGSKLLGGAAIAGAVASGALDDSEVIDQQNIADDMQVEYEQAQKIKKFIELKEELSKLGLNIDNIDSVYREIPPQYK